MCLISFAWKHHPSFKLILVANRDEFYDRPTAPLGYWHDHPEVLGGRDLKEGGTWMGMHRSGRFTAITNYRDMASLKMLAPSRGKLTSDFLTGTSSSEEFFENVKPDLNKYNGFNLLTLENDKLFYFNNIEPKLKEVSPGVYGLSNSVLDTPWPKVQKAKSYFSKSIAMEKLDVDEILDWMCDGDVASDELLPSTGVGLELERKLSAMCIATENYGTGCTTLVTISWGGEVNYIERTYSRGGRREGTVAIKFQIS